MKDIFLISKVLIKNSTFNLKRKGILGYIIVYSFLLGYTCFFCYYSLSALSTIGMERIFLNVILLSTLGLILFQNIITSINLLFFSKETEYILPLPIKSEKLFISKINVLLFTEYISNLIFFMPALVMYGIIQKCGFLYYIYSIIIFFIFPILPLMLVIFVITLLMNFTKLIKNKDVAQYISVIASILIIFTVIGISSKTSNNITTDEINSLLIVSNNISNSFSSYFITLHSSANALLNYNNIDGIKNMGLLLLETVIGSLVFFIIIKKFFIKIVLNTNSNGLKTLKIIDISKSYKKNKVCIAYLKKEFMNLSRNPVFCMQCLVPSILMPVVIFMPLVLAINNGGEDAQKLIEVFNTEKNTFWLGFRLIVLQFLYGISFVSITSISREGKDAFALKYLPIKYEKQIEYKVFVGTVLNLAPIIILTIFNIYVIRRIEFDLIVMQFVLGILSSLIVNYILVLIDLKHPKIKWDNEYAVVKQNINMIFGIFISTIMCLIILISILITNSIYIYFMILSAFYISLILLIKLYVRNRANKLFNNLNI